MEPERGLIRRFSWAGVRALAAIVTVACTGALVGVIVTAPPASAATKPTVPLAVQAAMAGPTTVHVSWTAPASTGGSEISQYEIYRWPGLRVGTVTRPAPGQPIPMAADVELAAGETSGFVVVATNAAGASGPSAPSATVTAPGTPPPPTNVSASISGFQAAHVSWSAPVVSALTPVISYEVRVADGTSLATVPGGSTQATVDLGDFGRTRSLRLVVLTHTVSGVSVASAPSNLITTGTAPVPPTNVAATLTKLGPDSYCVTVTWTASPASATAPITGYHVNQLGDGWDFENVDGGTTSTGCLPQYGGRGYQYVVEAENEYGQGAPSAPSNAVTVPVTEGAALPAPPTGVTATLTAHNAVKVNWSAIPVVPGTADGDIVYMVLLTPGGYTATAGGRLSTSTTVVVGDPSTVYRATVSAKNPGNHGAASAPSAPVTTLGSPAAPTNVVASVKGATEVEVHWTAPPVQANLQVTRYRVYAQQTAAASCALGPCAALGANPVEEVSGSPPATTTTFSGLDPNTPYRFTVRAWNAWSESSEWAASDAAPLSNLVTTPTVRPAPTSVRSVQSSIDSVHVSWTPPPADPLVPTTGYDLIMWPTATKGFLTSAGSTYDFTGVAPGTYAVYVRASNVVGDGRWSVASSVVVTAAPIGAGFHAVAPQRLLDSRGPTGGFGGPVAAGAPKALTVTNVGGIPGSASAVVMNVTATGSTANSFLTVYPAGAAKPNASNLNFAVGQTIPNLVTVKVGSGGQVLFATAAGATDVVADVVGWFDDATTPGDLFNGVTPARLLDSRVATGGWNAKLGAGAPNAKPLKVTGVGGVPTTATAVVLNTTVTNGTAGSFLQVWPTGAVRPNSSNLNFGVGQTTSNLVTVAVGTNGNVSFFNAAGSVDVVADVVAYFDPSGGSRFHPLAAPTRILDDRLGLGLTGPWGPGQTRTLAVAGVNGIGGSATGVIMNTTVTGGTQGSFVSVFPHGAALPISSTINFGIGQTIPNLVMTQLPAAGSVDIYNQLGSVDVIADAVGYYATT